MPNGGKEIDKSTVCDLFEEVYIENHKELLERELILK